MKHTFTVSHNTAISNWTQAQQAVRLFLRENPSFSGIVEVVFETESCVIDTPVVFSPEDSGSDKVSIVYRGANPAAPHRLTSAKKITDFEVLENGLIRAHVPAEQLRSLFVNGEMRQRTNVGKNNPFKFSNAKESIELGWANDPKTYTKKELEHISFLYEPQDLTPVKDSLKDAEVVILQYWMETRSRIANVSREENRIYLSTYSWNSLGWNYGYYLENVKEGLSVPGTWYYCHQEQAVYYRPLESEIPAELTITYPTIDQLVRFEGNDTHIENLHFENIEFACTTSPLPEKGHSYSQAELGAPVSLYAQGLCNSSFKKCVFRHLGGYTLWLAEGCKNNIISDCVATENGAGFIRVGSDEDPTCSKDLCCHTVIENNLIERNGTHYLGSAAIWIGMSGNNLVAHNEISGGHQWAISVGWRWAALPLSHARENIVEYNYIHHLGTGPLGTHGAIYFLGTQPNSAIRNNLINHVYASKYWGAGEGIILDNGCSGITIENNIVYDAAAGGYGSNFNCFGNIITNNIFAFGTKYQLTRYGDAPETGRHPNGEIFTKNILIWKDGPLFKEKDWWSYETYWDYNVYYNYGQSITFLKYDFEQWQDLYFDKHSVIRDPMIRDIVNGDFTLDPSSPAFDIGFEPIDTKSIGITTKPET